VRAAAPFLPPSGVASFPVLGLELKPEHRRRYETMRRKVESEIIAGTRTKLVDGLIAKQRKSNKVAILAPRFEVVSSEK